MWKRNVYSYAIFHLQFTKTLAGITELNLNHFEIKLNKQCIYNGNY